MQSGLQYLSGLLFYVCLRKARVVRGVKVAFLATFISDRERRIFLIWSGVN